MTDHDALGESRLRVALIGMGKMGTAIADLASSRGCKIVAKLDARAMSRQLTGEVLGDAQVAIDFTVPEAALDNAINCLQAGCPVVIGTTGWSREEERLERAVKEYGRAALWSPNFSMGLQLFLAAVEQFAGRVGAAPGFEMQVVETHHSGKKDAPSGTALAIAEAIRSSSAMDSAITSIRVGSVAGHARSDS